MGCIFMSELSTMISYAFIQKALIVGVLTGVIAAVLGVSLVLKNYSMIGDGLSHVGFGAFAIAISLGMAPLYFSIPVVIVAAFFTLKISNNKKINADGMIALLSSGALSIGVMATSLTKGMNVDIYQFMFGSILATTSAEVYITVAVSIFVILYYILFYNKIFAVTFDETFSRAIGINVNFYRVILSVITAIVIVLGMRVIGALLISGLTIFPALTSFRIAKSFKGSIVVSAIVAFASVVMGVIVSFFLSTPTGATIVVSNLFIYILAVIYGKVRKI